MAGAAMLLFHSTCKSELLQVPRGLLEALLQQLAALSRLPPSPT